jgi:hypothetical protein
MAIKQLSDGGDEGTVLGQSSTDKLGFFGLAAPVVKVTLTDTITTTRPVLGATAAYGFATTAQFNAVVDAVAALRTYGLV